MSGKRPESGSLIVEDHSELGDEADVDSTGHPSDAPLLCINCVGSP